MMCRNSSSVSSTEAVGGPAASAGAHPAMLSDRGLRARLLHRPPLAGDLAHPSSVERQALHRDPGPPPPAPSARAVGRQAPLAAHRSLTAQRAQPNPAQISLATALAQPGDADPMASRTGPSEVGCLPSTTAPSAAVASG